MKRVTMFLLVALFLASAYGLAMAKSSDLAGFTSTYPAAKGSALDSCNVCHSTVPALNKYGSDWAAAGKNFKAIEGKDSDGDGASNLAEIQSLTLPGDPSSKPASKPSTPAKPSAPKSNLQILAEKGLILGVARGDLGAAQPLTRAQLATVVRRIAGIPQSWPVYGSFSDVAKSAWYFGVVESAARAGYMIGYPDGTFHPNEPVTGATLAKVASNLGINLQDQTLAGKGQLTREQAAGALLDLYNNRSKIGAYLASAKGAGYVGGTTCSTCHEQHSRDFKAINIKTRTELGQADQYKPLTITVKYDPNATAAEDKFTVTYDATAFEEFKNRTVHPKKIMPVEVLAQSGNTWTITGVLPEAADKWEQSEMFKEGKLPWDFAYAMGSKWKQRYVLSDPERGLRVYTGSAQFNVYNASWVKYGDPGRDNWKDFAKGCIGCHATGWNGVDDSSGWNQLTMAPTARGFRFQDTGVTCEACHGPGGKHVLVPGKGNIVNPVKLTIKQQNDLCGSCHGRGEARELAGTDRDQYKNREYVYGFKPGDDLAAVYTQYSYTGNPIGGDPTTNTDIKGKDVKGFFWPDDTSKGHHQQYIDFIQSGKSKSVSCISCHSSHSWSKETLSLKQAPAQLCASCHGRPLDINTYMPFTAATAKSKATPDDYDIRSHVFKEDWPNDYPKKIDNTPVN